MPANLDFQRFSLNKRAAATGDLNGLICHLFTNNFNPGPFAQTADFTEASFDGYSPSAALVWNAAYNRPTGDFAEIPSMPASFLATSSTVPETIYGFYLTTPTGASPLGIHQMGSFLFPTPIEISHAGDGFSLAISIGYDGTISANLA